ncbi:MAG: sensor domain-containing diguanylate cyclase [Candidatus Omnitrophica bacterium]|nr:sensor domain-containing diguanylate cyclase [Candidatus Omnitrophota bacterium]
MIPLLKKRSSEQVLYFLALFGFPLAFFFHFAIKQDPRFFINLAAALFCLILYFFYWGKRLSAYQAEHNFKSQDIFESRNLVTAEIAAETKAIAALEDKIALLAKLKDLTELLGQCLYTLDTSKMLTNEAHRLIAAGKGSEATVILYLFHAKTGEFGISSSQKGLNRVSIKSKQGDAFDRWVVKTLQPLLVEDSRGDYRFDVEKIAGEDSRVVGSLISVPLVVGQRTLGILRVDHPREKFFTTDDLRFLAAIADLAAVAVENAQLYERAEQLAIFDGLTNLYQRRYLMGRIAQEISRHVRRQESLAFLMMDLDKFKDYNDRFGHVAGDIVLKTAAMAMTDYFSHIPGSLVARYGGEEFCVLLPDCSKTKAAELAEGLREKIAGQTIFLRRERTRVTISIGVAAFPQDGRDKDELIAQADQSLYRAKEQGRNRVCYV